jgi:hypothetical protein
MIHYKAIKLKSGELMACSSEWDFSTKDVLKNKTIKVDNPVIFQSFKFVDGEGELVETISMMPMIPISDHTTVEISADHVFSVSEMRPQAAEKYAMFLERLQEQLLPEMDVQAQAEYDEYSEEEEYDENVIDMTKYNPRLLH